MRTKAVRAARWLRASAVLIAVTAMVVVPPLLLATPQHTASTPRLARGFEPPPSKCSVARVAPAQFVVLARPLVPPVEWIDRDARAVLPHALPRTQTQTRRGPPSGGIA